jgi:RND superfamily putative drug exporter
VSGALYRLGHLCVRRHRIVLAIWLVLVVGLTVAVNVAGKQTSDNLTLPGTGSTKATNLLADKLPKQQNGTVPIVFVATSGKLDSGANKNAVDEAVKDLGKAPGVEKATTKQ